MKKIKLEWNRYCTIFVMLMFITVTYASFNTNLFINGKGYVRVDADIRITDIKVLGTENSAYESVDPEYTKDSITMDVNLPQQASTITYQVTIQNKSNYDYDIQNIVEEQYTNKNISYEITGLTVNDTILKANTTETFNIKLKNNTTITEEEDKYETLEYTFDYTGGEQEFIVPFDGEYTLEVWGAQGRSSDGGKYVGGYGGYSTGTISLKKNQKLYVNVGGSGNNGGYNSGDKPNNNSQHIGGGATHIATAKGKLENLSEFKGSLINNQYYSSTVILIVAGGGGANDWAGVIGNYNGAGGGFKGNSGSYGVGEEGIRATGGTQIDAGIDSVKSEFASSVLHGSFGRGSIDIGEPDKGGNGGGGFFGGGAALKSGIGAGGSGYIGNPNLKDRTMYCYKCMESTEESTKTISTENHSVTPTSNYAKEGNGYAKITVTRKVEDSSIYGYDYTGREQTFTAPYSGIYKLETWGAQGTSYNETTIGGYGGYSTGKIKLTKNDILYINVGGQSSTLDGGYNGGGSVKNNNNYWYGRPGGGATHIANTSGLLSALQSKINNIYIVSGAGGGASARKNLFFSGGSGGGYKGCNTDVPTGGTQTGPGKDAQYGGTGNFGLGSSSANEGAGGSGFYGGGSGRHDNIGYSGAGGSGYIGNPNLIEKVMYCYNCEESKEENTKTITTQAHSELPKQFQAKEGNGYAKITLLKRQTNNTKLQLKLEFAKRVNITFDYQYPYDYHSGNSSTTYNFENAPYYENVLSPYLGRIYFTDWKLGDEIKFEYDVSYTDLECKDESTDYSVQFQGQGDVTKWAPKLTTYHRNEFLGTGSTHVSLIHTVTTNELKNNSWLMNLRFDNYAKGRFTISNIVVNRIRKEKNAKHSTKSLGTLPTPDYYNEEYAFLGWYDDPEEGNKIDENAIVPDSNTTYYAHWELKNYNINYDLDGGTLSSPINTYNIESDSFTISNPTREGYEFVGWNEGNLIDVSTIKHNNKVSIIDTSNEEFEIKRNNSYYQANIWPMFDINHIGLIEGDNYTLSFDIWSDEEIGITRNIYINDRTLETHNLTKIKTTKQKLKVTFTFHNQSENPTGGSSVHIYPTIAKDSKNNIYLNNIQLEKGTQVTPYKKYAVKDYTIEKGTYGNKSLKAIWKDIESPSLSLTKETYFEGYDGWNQNSTSKEDEIMTIGVDGTGGNINKCFVVNDKSWRINFDMNPQTKLDDNEQGAIMSSYTYFDENDNKVYGDWGGAANGYAPKGDINKWTSVRYNSSGASNYSGGVYKTCITLSTGNDYSKSPVKIKNLKVSGEAIPNTFYNILVTSSD